MGSKILLPTFDSKRLRRGFLGQLQLWCHQLGNAVDTPAIPATLPSIFEKRPSIKEEWYMCAAMHHVNEELNWTAMDRVTLPLRISWTIYEITKTFARVPRRRHKCTQGGT